MNDHIFNALPDIPRLYTALSEWGACVVYVFAIQRKVKIHQTVGCLLVGLAVLIGIQYWAGTLPLAFWICSMCLAVSVMFAIIKLASGVSTLSGLYLVVRAFVLAELIASLHWQLDSFLSIKNRSHSVYVSAGLLLIIYGACGLAAWFAERNNFFDANFLPPQRSVLISLIIAVVTFAMSNLSFVSTNTPFSGRVGIEVFYIRTLVDLCGFAVLYAQQEQLRQHQVNAELASIEARSSSEHQEYLRSKENLEAMGRIAHDLKHQITALRMQIDPELQSQEFEQLERSVQEYSSQQHTGNPVLDVVLSSKQQRCSKEGITMSVVADGKSLEGMSPMDVSTLFGNALDNTIEALKQVENVEHRLARLALYASNQFTIVRIENYYTNSLNWRSDGGLKTTKLEKGFHGYGVTSIRHIAHKYGGDVSISADEHWFKLCVVLPQKKGKLHLSQEQ